MTQLANSSKTCKSRRDFRTYSSGNQCHNIICFNHVYGSRDQVTCKLLWIHETEQIDLSCFHLYVSFSSLGGAHQMPMAFCLNSCAIPLLHRGHTVFGPQQIFRSSSDSYQTQCSASLEVSCVSRKKCHTKADLMKGREEMHVAIFIFID